MVVVEIQYIPNYLALIFFLQTSIQGVKEWVIESVCQSISYLTYETMSKAQASGGDKQLEYFSLVMEIEI